MTLWAPTDAQRRDWLRLARSENVGPVTFEHLIQNQGDATPALAALPLLGAAAIVMVQNQALRRYAAAAAFLSLALATPFRWAQIESFMSEHLSRRPPFEKDLRQLVFVTPDYPHYTQDFVQNDPFLRAPVIFMLSRGRSAAEKLVRARFPGARLTHQAQSGQVWRVD